MKKTALRITRLVLGWAFLALGVVGLFVPILQGILLILLGLALLSRDSRWARRCLTKLRLRYPGTYAAMRRLKARLAGLFSRSKGLDNG